jgi:putative spermidine/putrescine transport system permease protein
VVTPHLQRGASDFYPSELLAAGAFLSFIASIDNVPVSLFLSNARTDMLPIRLWGMMESTLDVRVAVASGVLISCVIVLVMALVGLSKRT